MSAGSRFLDPAERAIFLGALAVPAEFEPEELAMMAERVYETSFPAGAVLLRPDEPVRTGYIVVEGAVRVTGQGLRGELLPPRLPLGFLSMVARSPRGIAAVAESDVFALALDAADLADALENDFSFLRGFQRSIARDSLALRRAMASGEYLAPAAEPASIPVRRLDLVDRVLLLRRRGPFARGSIDALARIAADLGEVRHPAGTPLWRLGEPSGFLLVILSGVVRCRRPRPDAAPGADPWDSFRCGPGYPLGNLESLAALPRWYDAESETPLVALRADSEVLLDAMEDNFGLAQDVLGSMADHLLELLETARERGLLPGALLAGAAAG